MTVIGVGCASLSWLQMAVDVVFQVGPSVVCAFCKLGSMQIGPDFDAGMLGWVVTGMGLGIMAAVGIGGRHNQWQMWW